MTESKRTSKPRKRAEPAEHVPPQPYQIHRPDVAAIDVQPRAGEYPVPITYSAGDRVIGTGILWMSEDPKVTS